MIDFLSMAVNRASLPAHVAKQTKKFTALLKKLKSYGLKLPESIILNPLAKKYLC